MTLETYRGWEIHEASYDCAMWTGDMFEAYRGGCDLDARRVSGKTIEDVKAEIDDYEEDLV